MRVGPRMLPPLLLVASAGCGKASSDGSSTGTDETGTGETGSLVCSEYASTAEIGPAVTVEVTHAGSTPVWFYPVGCGGGLPLAIRPADGEPFGWRESECSPVYCDEFFDAADCTLGCNDCAPPNLGSIQVGANRDTSWSGVMHVALDMSAACAPGENCQRECLRRDQAPDGSYVVELTAYATCTGTCGCDNESDGICLSWDGGAQLSEPLAFEQAFEYPAPGVVQLVLDP